MNLSFRFVATLGVVAVLSACGGGSGDSGNGGPKTSGPTVDQIIAKPADYNATQLKQAYQQKVASAYRGTNNPIELDPSVASYIVQNLLGNASDFLPTFSYYDFSDLPANTELNESIQCDFGGLVQVRGSYSATTVSTLEFTYQNCNFNPYYNMGMSGSATLKVLSSTNTSFEHVLYYNNVTINVDQIQSSISGYVQTTSSEQSTPPYMYNNRIENHLLITLQPSQAQILDKTVMTYEYEDGPSGYSYSYTVSGTVSDSALGQVAIEKVESTVSTNQGYVTTDYIKLSGLNDIMLEDMGLFPIKYLQDSDGDGEYELGAYITNWDDWFSGNLDNLNLVSIDMLSLPPYSGSPYVYAYGLTTVDSITAEPGYYYDDDNETSELSISYRWYVNGTLMEQYQGDTLPPYVAVYEDEVSVSMVVTDGVSTVESDRYYFYLNDSPAQLRVYNKPDSVQSGDLVQFTVLLEDPDIGGQDAIVPVMTSAPIGASMDQDGLVVWQTQTDSALFSSQIYTFEFTNDESPDAERKYATINVLADTPMPLARSGMVLPYENRSMWIADYDGDGENEILSGDDSRILLAEFTENGYQQIWAYPYTMPTDGLILQKFSANIDDDSEHEIFVVTEQGISLINGLDKPASVVFSGEKSIFLASVLDFDGDGKHELVYLSSDDSYYGSERYINVVSYNDPNTVLLRENIGGANDFTVANVDSDAQLEIVINNGYVFDSLSWSNQWVSGTPFGSAMVVAADLTGDGIAEIIGADSWDKIRVMSALDKSQITTLDVFNTCTLAVENVDEDPEAELLVGDCQWGEVSAYDLSQNTLVKRWGTDLMGHGSRSLVTGDSDNDGELEIHWGTGLLSTGSDGLVVVDLLNNQPQEKFSGTIQYGSFKASGWGKTGQTDELGVFFVPNSGGGYGDSVVVKLASDGTVEHSEFLSSNWNSDGNSLTVDTDKDGISEIFVPTTDYSDGSLSVLRLDDMSEIWKYSLSGSGSINTVKAHDLNNDDVDDMWFSSSSTLRVLDYYNQTQLASYDFSRHIVDFVPFVSSDKQWVAVASNEKLHLMKRNNSSFSEADFVEQSCYRIDIINADDDSAMELVCLQQYDYMTNGSILIFFEIVNESLVEKSRLAFGTQVEDFEVNRHNSKQQTLYIATNSQGHYNYSYQPSLVIHEVNLDSGILWSSPSLVGSPQKYGIKHRYSEDKGNQLLIATSLMMYWVNP